MILLILVIVLVTCSGSNRNDLNPDCDAVIWFEDRDGDGFGVITSTLESCDPTPGFVAMSGDCDDTTPFIAPGLRDGCDAIDTDCDGSIDEDGDTSMWFPDADGDGFGSATAQGSRACDRPLDATPDSSDCDDANAAIHPGADETCDGIDEDCSGQVDEDPVDGIPSFPDDDGDGWGDDLAPWVDGCLGTDPSVGGDCDDDDDAIHPEAVEDCNGIDDDCDGELDQGLPLETFWVDADGDGYGDPLAPPVEACAAPPGHRSDNSDCDDSSAAVFPGAPELCNLTDDDCDGTYLDENVDDDADGWSVCDGDCDDSRADVNPDAPEICDDFDNDCSGVTNDPWRDDWEPNETLASAPRVANDDQIAMLQPNVSGPDDLYDWFEMNTFDDADPVFDDDFRAWARVENIPAGVELALLLYRNDVFGNPTLVDSDFTWGDGTLEVERNGVWGSNDGNLYFVGVEVLAGYSCTQNYTLRVGNND